MSARALGGIAIAAILGALGWIVLLRSDEGSSAAPVRPPRAADLTPSPTPARSGAAAPARPAATAATPPDAPALPGVDPREEALAGELRDPAWAGATERALRTRFAALRGARLADAECRTRQCRLVIVGTRDQLGRTIAELAGAHGLHGYARDLALAPPEPRPDGAFAMRAYAQFSR